MASYSDSLPPSFGNKWFSNSEGAAISNYDFGTTINQSFANPKFDFDRKGVFNSVADRLSGLGALAGGGGAGPGWTFITAPEDVSWVQANNAKRVDMFGTNNPPMVAGTKGMRDLTLGNALVEGFVRGVQVEKKIKALEKLTKYGLNKTDGYVSVPVYQVWANKKSYGGKRAYYIIKSVKVKEVMRDLSGKATRAYVDIEFMEIPAYQVNSGRDQASSNISEAGLYNSVSGAAGQGVGGTGANSQAKSGPGAGSSTPAKASGGNTGYESGPGTFLDARD